MFNYIKNKSVRWFVRTAVLMILIATFVFVIVESVKNPISKNGGNAPWLKLWQCTVGIAALFVPDLLEKKLKLIIPSSLIISYIVLLFCSVYLGEIHSFYYNFTVFGYRVWDVMLHLSYSAMLVALGFSILGFLNRAEHIQMKFSPLFVVMFAFFFAITVDVFWEIFEFSVDFIGGYNMQKYKDEKGIAYIGQKALLDTMKDLIVDVTGALIMCIISYISVRRHKNFFDAVIMKRKNDTGNAVEEMIYKPQDIKSDEVTTDNAASDIEKTTDIQPCNSKVETIEENKQ